MKIVQRLGVTFAIFLVCLITQAQDVTKLLQEKRQQELTALQTQVETLGKEMMRTGGARRAQLGRVRKMAAEKIKRLQNPKKEYVPYLEPTFPLNSFGKLPYYYDPPRVVYVVDEDEFVGEFVPEGKTLDEKYRTLMSLVEPAPEAGSSGAFASMMDSYRLAVRDAGPKGRVYIKGIPTKNVGLGTYQSELPFSRSLANYYFEVFGTKDHNGINMTYLRAYPDPKAYPVPVGGAKK